MTDQIEPSGTTKYAYNAAGLAARIRWRDTSSAYFFYDNMMQRYGAVLSGTATYFLWDGPNLLQELHADGTVKEEHTIAQSQIAGIGQLVETYRPGESAPDQKIYPLMDPRGSITKWVKSDGTTVLASREYDAFGRIIPGSATGTWPGRVGYQGQACQELVSADGSQRVIVTATRILDPLTGRFLQNEPLVIRRPRLHYLYVKKQSDAGRRS